MDFLNFILQLPVLYVFLELLARGKECKNARTRELEKGVVHRWCVWSKNARGHIRPTYFVGTYLRACLT